MTPKLIRHIHSNREWWWMGNIPGTRLGICASKDGVNSYIVGLDDFSTFYKEVPSFFEEGKNYKSINTGSTIWIDKVSRNPDNGMQTAFAWRRSSPEIQAHPITLDEGQFAHWELQYRP